MKDSTEPTEAAVEGKSDAESAREVSQTGKASIMGLHEDSWTNDSRELEETRMDSAAARIRQVEWLEPTRWSELDVTQKAIALNEAGRVLSEVYHQPSPPLFVADLDKPTALGAYGDGYRFDPATGDVEGSPFGIQMNREIEMDGKKLFGDDPRQALETYAHEYRHAYQAEQAGRYEKPQFRNLVDDDMNAFEWSQNINEYQDPSYGFEAYYNQPIEKDARAFAERLVQKIYG